ncbi:peptide chain release factor N(5)-glutamine methyltransferase [Natribacillus halophilus]|uniref:Release factor glutamine methyltransferase n=1 Tax=Natribacillus halophilus TaxID=549003 RepID=A0A1G8KV61_9BACI|nr:peptide chain release factor N(5)-glutamine methyltransferase [Natribacillus halophilus]SDI47292.1 release factor glutamine methyltransferase [Natribacillus halophilus]
MTEAPRVFEALQRASSFLQENGLEKKAADTLMQEVLQLEGSDPRYHLHKQERLTVKQYRQYQEMVERHGRGEPVQYITGVSSFYGRRFKVNETVLVPRQETEELVEIVLEKAGKLYTQPTIADIGTGSGAIALTLALEWPKAEVLAFDISDDAMRVARENARTLGAPAVKFIHGNMASPLREQARRVDVLVANPPYIATRDWRGLDAIVRDYEPRQALDGGGDGLFYYRQLAEDLPYVLAEGGMAFLEIGDLQGPSVALLFEQQLPAADVDIVQDINRKDRFVVIES